MTPREKLMAGRLKAKQSQPYLASVLYALVPQEHKGLGTMGVTKTWVLLYDPDTIGGWSVDDIAVALVHECWHCLRKHAERCEAMSAIPMVWNIAADCEINDDMLAGGAKFPHGYGVKPSDFGEKDGNVAEAYYNNIRQKIPPQDGGGGGGKGKDGAGENSPGSAPGKPGVGQGWCGSGGGKPMPDEPAGGDDKGRKPAEQERVRKTVAHEIQREAAKGRGSVPAGFQRWADEALSPPKVRWQDKLKRAAKNAVQWRAGQTDLHYGHPSRRQGGIGYGPGKPVLPALRSPVPVVWLVVDTSGSMGQHELTIAVREAAGALKATGAPCTFVSCDAAVHEVREVEDWKQMVGALKGGGGTDFTPVFDYASTESKVRPDVIVFATDGDGACPPTNPLPSTKTIWLLTGAHARVPCEWGEAIKVED